MKIYGVALLAGCFLIGHIVGDYFGKLFHLNGNLGGVGFAMLLLIFTYDYAKKKSWLAKESEALEHHVHSGSCSYVFNTKC